jgi:hypothetical protein
MEKGMLVIFPMIHDGTVFRRQPEITLWTPYQGDFGLSPSNLIAVSRISGVDADYKAKQMGFQFDFIEKNFEGDTVSYSLRKAATLCFKGGKGGFSFDERYFATYHYVDNEDFKDLGFADREDSGFQKLLEKGSSNIFAFDLKTGVNQRITNMGPGQFALFPHYRSDGWIYFLVHDANTKKRYMVATDASLVGQ